MIPPVIGGDGMARGLDRLHERFTLLGPETAVGYCFDALLVVIILTDCEYLYFPP